MADSRGTLAAPPRHSNIRSQLTKHSVRAVISGLRSPVGSTGVLTPAPKAFMPEGSLFDRPGGATAAFVAILAIAVIFLAGCGKKSLSKTELRAVTDEVVSAAQRITGRKSEITIRPEAQPPRPGAPASLAADNIYISLADPSQTTALRQALAEIARRHKLSIAESSAGGIIRYDFSRDGIRTHAIHVVTPLALRSRATVPRLRGNPQLAIILDDMGTTAPPPILCSRCRFRSRFQFFLICRYPRRSPKRPIAEAMKSCCISRWSRRLKEGTRRA